jgi:hypothetical protein
MDAEKHILNGGWRIGKRLWSFVASHQAGFSRGL